MSVRPDALLSFRRNNYKGHRDLTAELVGNTHDTNICHIRVAQQEPFELCGGDLTAIDFDNFLKLSWVIRGNVRSVLHHTFNLSTIYISRLSLIITSSPVRTQLVRCEQVAQKAKIKFNYPSINVSFVLKSNKISTGYDPVLLCTYDFSLRK